MEDKVIAFIRELCEGCGGCSTMPTSVDRLCSNPLASYLYRKCPSSKTESEAYFRGRRDGLMMASERGRMNYTDIVNETYNKAVALAEEEVEKARALAEKAYEEAMTLARDVCRKMKEEGNEG